MRVRARSRADRALSEVTRGPGYPLGMHVWLLLKQSPGSQAARLGEPARRANEALESSGPSREVEL